MTGKNSAIFNESLQRMRFLCSKQEKSSYEIKLKLTERNLTDQEINRIISILSEENFINDARYAISFTHDKLKFNKWGRIKIQYQLRHKGIAENYITNALEKIDNSEYKQILKEEIVKKNKGCHVSGKYELKSKLMRFGQARGFETDLVYQVIDELLSNK